MKNYIITLIIVAVSGLGIAGCDQDRVFYHTAGWYTDWDNFNQGEGHLLIYYWDDGSIGTWDTARDSDCWPFSNVILPWQPDAYISGNWGNNPDCDTLLACPDNAGSMVMVAYNAVEEGSGWPSYHTVRWIVDSTSYSGPRWDYDLSNGNYQTNAELPRINVWPISFDSGPSPYTFTVRLTLPDLPAVYGDGSIGPATNAVAGIVVVYQTSWSGNEPYYGREADWTPIPNPDDAYYSMADLGTSYYITMSMPTNDWVWFSYKPILQYQGACVDPTDCTVDELQALDLAGFDLAFVARNSDRPMNPTPVTFSDFTARYDDIRTVQVTWETATEMDAQGFYLYRSLDGENWTRLNDILFPAEGVGGAGSSYSFVDHLAKQRTYQRWQYRVEEITVNGERASEARTEVIR